MRRRERHDDLVVDDEHDRAVNPHEVLGVRPTASPEEIRRAYLRLARLHHPDVVPAGERLAADVRLRVINEAWTMLRDGTPQDRGAEPPPDPGFRPFDPSEEETDARDQPDVPYRPGASVPRTSIVPVLFLGAAFVAFAVSLVVRLLPLLAIGLVLLALAGVGFLAIPLIALGRARRDEG